MISGFPTCASRAGEPRRRHLRQGTAGRAPAAVPQATQGLGEGALGAAEEVQGLQIRQEGVALNEGLEEGLILEI